jgi:hypothetical protein
MLNMLGDRLRNVTKNCQFHCPFESKGCRPNIPHIKALALLKKIKKDCVGSQSQKVLTPHTKVKSTKVCKGCVNEKSKGTGVEGLKTREFSNKCILCPSRVIPRGSIYRDG